MLIDETRTLDGTVVAVGENVIDHPSHYNVGTIEAIDVIEDWNLDFSLGSTVKYICRAGRKDGNTKLQDLQKASWYINREIERESKMAKQRVIDHNRINKANATIKRFRETVDLESLTQGEQTAVACAFEKFADELEKIMSQRAQKTVASDDELAKVFIETFAKQLAMAVAEGKTNTDAEN